MTRKEYNHKQSRFNTLFEKWFSPNPSITPAEMREMSALRDELAAYDQDRAFFEAVRRGEISAHS